MSQFSLIRAALVLVLSIVGLSCAPIAFAQAPKSALLPIDQFTQFPAFSSIAPSPDGKLLAAVAPTGKRLGLLIWNIETGSGSVVAHYNDMDVNAIAWVNNKRLTYSLLDRQAGTGEQIGSGFFAIDIDGKNRVELSSLTGQSDQSVGIYRGFGFVSRVGKEFDEDEIYARKVGRSIYSSDIYRLNTRTGKSVLITNDSPGFVSNWLVSKDEKTTVATTYEDDTGKVSVKVKRAGIWVTISEFDRDDQGWAPLTFDPEKKDNNTLIVLTNRGRDTTAIARYDLTTDKITDILAEHPRFDLGWPADDSSVATPRILRNIDTEELLGIRVELDKQTTIWLSTIWQTYQNTVDKSLPNRVNRLSSLGKTGDVLVLSYSDRQPGEYFVYSPNKKALKEVFSTRPWIKEELMAEQRFITYTARDGRKISAYITIPNSSKGKPVPLVVHPHGGPWLRNEYFGWQSEPQFFASRGYMVIQPEFRGTKGFGYAHFAAGFKQWGLTMQDDLTDGVMHLVKEGLVDKNKVCIVGASYGGYAVSMGLVKDPDLYKCGINVVGVTASQYMNEVTWTDFSRSKSAERSLNRIVGDAKLDAAVLAAGNAVDQAAKIKAPMLMLYGLRDRRVPLINGERMRDALVKHGKKHEWVVYKEEGHGFRMPENRIDYYTRMQNFLAENLK
jgi:dipeptidyl aminopeptidase/acylaminoacyl peptidase